MSFCHTLPSISKKKHIVRRSVFSGKFKAVQLWIINTKFHQVYELHDASTNYKDIAENLRMCVYQVGYALRRAKVTPKKKKGHFAILSSEVIDGKENVSSHLQLIGEWHASISQLVHFDI